MMDVENPLGNSLMKIIKLNSKKTTTCTKDYSMLLAKLRAMQLYKTRALTTVNTNWQSKFRKIMINKKRPTKKRKLNELEIKKDKKMLNRKIEDFEAKGHHKTPKVFSGECKNILIYQQINMTKYI